MSNFVLFVKPKYIFNMALLCVFFRKFNFFDMEKYVLLSMFKKKLKHKLSAEWFYFMQFNIVTYVNLIHNPAILTQMKIYKKILRNCITSNPLLLCLS